MSALAVPTGHYSNSSAGSIDLAELLSQLSSPEFQDLLGSLLSGNK